MEDASPAKWHLAHTTWFFETFVLAQRDERYERFDGAFNYLFNSYYNSIGDRQPRRSRGMLTRPPIDRVLAYRRAVDERVLALLDSPAGEDAALLEPLLLGLQHEQQHQELLLTDIKHLLSCNPLLPAYDDRVARPDVERPARAPAWTAFEEGVYEIGSAGDGFCFDNERPRHRVFLEPFELADRLVTNGEYLAFIDDGGYQRAELWLDEGWQTVLGRGWRRPIYWQDWDRKQSPTQFTLGGERALTPSEPVCHVSFYEADAYARWAGARLPTEAEWETAAASNCIQTGNLLDSGALHPASARALPSQHGPVQLIGDVWEWTRSAHEPYPGYSPPAGALGEYNGKFMCNQLVLRGGSCFTPAGHIRPTYRNFFHADKRWQCAGIRLAREAR